MNNQISIITPESVEFSLELAGIGSRFAALLIDSLIQAVATIFVLIAFSLIISFGRFALPGSLETFFLSVPGALLLFLIFIIQDGYFIFFEALKNGQTPGKYIMGLRVIKESGYPISFLDSAIRNILRIADFFPAFYLIGLISMWLSKRYKRLGDFAAGTVVVKERLVKMPPFLPSQREQLETPEEKVIFHNIERLSKTDYEIVRKFLFRRDELDLKARQELARRIAISIMNKLQLSDQEYALTGYEKFLEDLARVYRQKEKFL